MKALKLILAVALASQLLVACNTASNSNNSNSNSNSNSKNTSNSNNTNSTSKTSNSEAPAEKSSTAANGDNIYTHKEGGIQFELPAGWKAEPNGDQMTLSTPDNALSVVLWVPAEEDFQQAVGELDKELGKTIKNVKTNGEPKETQVGGMTTYSQSGTGEVEGNEIQWSVDIIKAKKPVIALTFAAPGIWEKHQADYQKFGRSIKPIS